jgi:two-component system response regulator HydG
MRGGSDAADSSGKLMTPTILVVDDDPDFRELMAEILAAEGYLIRQAASAENALDALTTGPVHLVLTDQRMPGLDGLELTRRVRAASEPPEVIVMTAFGTIPQAVEAVRLGAADYITKPLESPAALRRLVRMVLGESVPANGVAPEEFLTRDPETLATLALADRAAATDATVLITGASGTGKELLARRIHNRSKRADRPFVPVNSAAIPDNLAESELFGHEKGAFTGADKRRIGRFEQADGGTLFLDEVGELPQMVQAKLLRTLEERTVERVGGTTPVPVDIRLVAATNRDLEHGIETGHFREDLFYRLNVVRLELTPLSERRGDLELLVPVLVESLSARLGTPTKTIGDEAMNRLKTHSWPGNVRELRNVLERALIASSGNEIRQRDLPELGQPGTTAVVGASPISLTDRERIAILEALEQTGGHREKAAELLGVSVRTLYSRLKDYDIR